jgi:hypothetical protein
MISLAGLVGVLPNTDMAYFKVLVRYLLNILILSGFYEENPAQLY